MAGYFSGQRLYNAVSCGTHYIMIPLNSVRIVRNAQLYQVMEGGTNHPCTLSQCNDHSRSWELILWSYQVTKKGNCYVIVFQNF